MLFSMLKLAIVLVTMASTAGAVIMNTTGGCWNNTLIMIASEAVRL